MACKGNCGSCGGCRRELTLTEAEIDFLKELGQIPFLPVARKIDDPTPVYPQGGAQMSLVIQCLEKKSLIALDFDKPLAGFDGYGDFPLKGSLSLTERGYQVLELMEYQGITT